MEPPLYLLDTSILFPLITGKNLGEYIDSKYKLIGQPYMSLICVVTRAEIWSLAEYNKWGPDKRNTLITMLKNLVQIDISSEDVINAYVEIDC